MTEKRFTRRDYAIYEKGNPICMTLRDVDKRLNELWEENEQLKQQISNIRGQMVMLDNCDNWDYDRMKHTVREIAEIIGYNGTINPKR